VGKQDALLTPSTGILREIFPSVCGSDDRAFTFEASRVIGFDPARIWNDCERWKQS